MSLETSKTEEKKSGKKAPDIQGLWTITKGVTWKGQY